MLSAKAALCLRVDALSELNAEGMDGEDINVDDDERAELGIRLRAGLEDRLRKLEGRPLLSKGTKIAPNGATPSKFEVKPSRNYNADADAPAADSKKSKPMIQEVEDTPMADADSEEDEDSDAEMGGTENGKVTSSSFPPRSPTISSVSDDTESVPSPPPEQWQSSIVGATREAKKARKKERHERNLALADQRAAKRKEKKAKEARKIAKEEKRVAKKDQEKRRAAREDGDDEGAAAPATLSEADYARLAEEAGISVTKFKRKYERGDIKMDGGAPQVVSKKELKKQRKEEAKKAAAAEEDSASSKKRKHADEETTDKKSKKKSKKEKSA